MKHGYLWYGVTLLTVGGTALAMVKLSSSPQKELEAVYARFNVALKKRDTQALSALLAPDFQEKRLTGEMRNRSQAEANYRQLAQDWLSFDSQTVEIDRLVLKGEEANVIANKRVSGLMTDRNGTFGLKAKTHQVVGDTMEMDVWVRTAEGWKLKYRQIVMAEILVDGQKFRSQGYTAHEHDHEH